MIRLWILGWSLGEEFQYGMVLFRNDTWWWNVRWTAGRSFGLGWTIDDFMSICNVRYVL